MIQLILIDAQFLWYYCITSKKTFFQSFSSVNNYCNFWKNVKIFIHRLICIHWENYITIFFHIEWIRSWWQYFFRFWTKLSPRSYPIQCGRKWKYSFLSVHLAYPLVKKVPSLYLFLTKKISFMQTNLGTQVRSEDNLSISVQNCICYSVN